MDARLQEASRDGNIEALYQLIKMDPFVLENLQETPFSDTPLHIAAAAGQTLFAIEILRLKPSYGKKLDTDGLSPLHLALKNNRFETSKRLVEVDRELLRVRGREGWTPLHYIVGEAEEDDNNIGILSDFLMAFPAAIDDVTIRGESALHIAMKKKKMRVLKVLVGLLKWLKKQEILNKMDIDGNTILHIAAETNQPQAMKFVITKENKNRKNLAGSTPLDIILSAEENNNDVGRLLRGALRASSLPKMETSDFLTSSPNIRDRIFYYKLLIQMGLSIKVQSALLVVAALIMTITYQGILSPPGGLRQYIDENTPLTIVNITMASTNSTTNFITSSTTSNTSPPYESDDGSIPGTTMMENFVFALFGIFNTIAFLLSALVIIFITESLCGEMRNLLPVRFLISSYLIAFFVISPISNNLYLMSIVVSSVPFMLQLFSVFRILEWILSTHKQRSPWHYRKKMIHDLTIAHSRYGG